MVTPNSVRASAPGKINLFFAVGALGGDGYHDVASLYLSVNLRESVSVAAASGWSVEVAGDLGAAQVGEVPTDESNLVVKTAKAVAAVAGFETASPIAFSIEKRVPVAGGMGGGSADAAAALVAIDDLWCTGLTPEARMRVSAGLGADVPFALTGGAAIGTGRGDQLEMLGGFAETHWVLCKPGVGLSTPEVYRRLDQLREAAGVDLRAAHELVVPQALIEALEAGNPEVIAQHLRNDLQVAAIDLRPELADLLALGKEIGALASVVSGSGPTVAMLARDAAHATQLADALAAKGVDAIATSGPSAPARIESN